MISLESTKFSGQHVGILPSGQPKPPSQTGRGAHASFTVELIQKAAQDAGGLSISFGGLHLHIVRILQCLVAMTFSGMCYV